MNSESAQELKLHRPRPYNQMTEAPGARWSSWPSKPLILSFAARMVGSTPTRFRHIYLMGKNLQNKDLLGDTRRYGPQY
jgi:hypothetical protein